MITWASDDDEPKITREFRIELKRYIKLLTKELLLNLYEVSYQTFNKFPDHNSSYLYRLFR